MRNSKLLLRLPFILLAVLTLTACPPEVEDFLNASSDKVEIVNGKGEVTIHSNVKWNVTSKPTWLNCLETEGQGEKILQFTADENPDTVQRSGTLTVKSTVASLAVNINVWQKGSSKPKPIDETDAITLNTQTSAALNVASSGGKSGVNVSANNNWSISQPEYSEGTSGWITIIGFTPGTIYGKGTVYVEMNIEENHTTAERSATITFSCGKASARLTVKQAKEGEKLTIGDDKKTTIDYAFTKNENDSVKFKVESNVTWTATSDKQWCNVKPGRHSNDGEITIVVDNNDGKDSRSAVVTVNSGNLTCKVNVTQPGKGAFLTVNKSISATVAFDKKDAASKTFSIESNVAWEVSSDQSWCTASPKSGSNDGTVTVSVTANNGSKERTATVTVKGSGITRTVTVTQSGEAYLTVNKSISATVAFDKNDAASKTFSIESNVAWEVSSDQNWCTVTPKSGSNSGTVTVSVTANNGSKERTATVTVKGGGITRTVTVTQVAPEIKYLRVVEEDSFNFDRKSATSIFSIESNVNWTINRSTLPDWLTLSQYAGSNDARVSATVKANENEGTRTADIIVSGDGVSSKTIRISQTGVTLSLSIENLELDAEGNPEKITISCNGDWSIANGNYPAWCTITSNDRNGSGNKTISVYAENNTGDQRSGTVTVTSGNIKRTFGVTQRSGKVIPGENDNPLPQYSRRKK